MMVLTVAEQIRSDRDRVKLTWETFALLANGDILKRALTEHEVDLKLEGVDFFSHDGVIWLAFICLYRHSKGLKTYIALPESQELVSHIKRFGLASLQDTLEFTFTNEYKLWNIRDVEYEAYTPKRIQLINPGNGLNINNAAVRHVKNYLLSHLNDVEESSEKYNELVRPFTKTIRELIHNVSQHGGLEEAQGSGLVIYTPPPKRYPWFRFCCSDIGEGFLGTIRDRRGIPCTTDREAVIEALLLRFFRKEEGVAGLYNAMRFIRERTGRIGIRTGGTYTLLDLSRPKLQHIFDEGYSTPSRDWLLDLTSSWNMPHIPGSHIFVDLRMPQED